MLVEEVYEDYDEVRFMEHILDVLPYSLRGFLRNVVRKLRNLLLSKRKKLERLR